MSNSLNYVSLVAALEDLVETFVSYSKFPPIASLEKYHQKEKVVQDWLALHKDEADDELWRRAELLGIQCRRYFSEGNIMAKFRGGDGRPEAATLQEWEQRLKHDLEGIIERIRSLSEEPQSNG